MHLVPVDEPPGGDVADLGVVLPAVPEPPDDLEEVGRLVEEVGDRIDLLWATGRRSSSASAMTRRPNWRASRRRRRPVPAARRGRGSHSQGWRWTWRRGTARCASSWPPVRSRWPTWWERSVPQRGPRRDVLAPGRFFVEDPTPSRLRSPWSPRWSQNRADPTRPLAPDRPSTAPRTAPGVGRRAPARPRDASPRHRAPRRGGVRAGLRRSRRVPSGQWPASRAWCRTPHGAAGCSGSSVSVGRSGHHREHAFTHGIGLFEMWMTRQDELVEPEVVVLEDALCHLLVAPDEGRAGTGRTSPIPAQRLGLTSRSSRLPSCSDRMRCWPTDSLFLQKLLRRVDEGRVHRVEQSSRLGPRLTLSVAGDHMEAHAEADGPTLCLGLLTDPLDPLPGHLRWFTPQQVHVDIPRGNVLGDARGSTEEHLGDRVRRCQGGSTPDLVVPALEVEGLLRSTLPGGSSRTRRSGHSARRGRASRRTAAARMRHHRSRC